MLVVGEIVKLSDDKEYIVINISLLHNKRYIFLMSNFKPLKIIIAAEKFKDGEITLEEVKDNAELDYILSQFVLNEDKETNLTE